MSCECENPVTVLIADDDKNVRMALESVFAATPYQVIAQASNGAQALSLCRRLSPDIALLDIKMPIMTGIEAAKEIIRDGLSGCVVMLTAFNDLEYVENASETGVAGYLVKPIDSSRILSTLDVCLKKAEESTKARNDMVELQKRQSSHETVKRAKLLIMENRSCSEQDAYTLLRELSRRKNVSMEAVAKGFIEKLGGTDD